MGDENPIRTLGDYSKPSHKGYRNTIELPVGNNVVPLRSDTIRLVQNECSFYGLRSEDPNQHLKDFLKLVDSLALDGDNKERMRLCLFQFSFRDQASNWLERRTGKLYNDILMFQQHNGESLSECIENPKQAFVDYASSRTDEAGDARLSRFEADFKRQQGEMTNKIDTVLKAIIDQIAGTLPSDTVKNPKLGTFQGGNHSQTSLQLPEVEIRPQLEPTLEDEFQDLHLNLPVLKVLAHAPIYNAILDKYIESLELGKNKSAFVQGEVLVKMEDPKLFTLPCSLAHFLPIRIDSARGLEELDQPRNLQINLMKPILLVGKSKKGLVAELFNWDDKSVSSEDEGVTRVKEFMAIIEDEPSIRKADVRSGQCVEITLKKISPEITTDSESECDNQELLHPLPNISRTEPIEFSVKAIKKKTQTKSPSVPDPSTTKKADSSTEKLLLTLMEEVKGLKKQIKPSLENSATVSQTGSSKSTKGVKQYQHRYSKVLGSKVVFGDNSPCNTKGYGSINCNGITFTKVAYVNGLKHNLMSISQLCDANFKVLFTKTQRTIFNQNNEVTLIAPIIIDVYVIDMLSYNEESNACFFAKASYSVNWLWHKRLSHLNFKNINELARKNIVVGLPSLTFSKDKTCSAYEKWKHHGASLKTNRSFSISKCLHILHIDLFGPIKPQTISHNKYTLVIVNEYSRRSREKRILLVNILDEPQAGVTIRSKVKDSEATSVHEFLYQANPKESHLVAVKRIFRYLKGNPNLDLCYPKGLGFNLKAYSNSNYTGCNLDRKSTSKVCQTLSGKLVCWSAKKPSSAAMSSAKAEFVAAAGFGAQVFWIKNQLADYDVLYDKQREGPIEYINKAMAFLSTVESRFLPSNNLLKTSSNPRNQATIQDGRVTVQQVQGRQTQCFAGTRNKGITTTLRGNYAEKLMLAEAQEAGHILDEEQLAFIADPGIAKVQVTKLLQARKIYQIGIIKWRRYKSTTTITNSTTRSPQMVSYVKLPILKKGEYILWTMKMKQYLAYTDYTVWEVILNGNGKVQMTKDEADEHLARLHGIKDAKTLWAAIKTRFGAWSNISMIIRNKPSIDNLDIDDLYNNIKVNEADIKGSSGSSSNSQNVAFVSAESTSSTNELNATYSGSTATCHSSQAQGSSLYIDELMFSFFANQSNSPQLDNEDLEQINQDDLEEMDLKWQVAMLSMRVKNPRNKGRDAGNAGYRGRDNGKRPAREEDEKALVIQDGLGTYDWSYQLKEEVTDFALMAFTSNPSSSNSKVLSCSKQRVQSYEQLKNLFDEQHEKLRKANLEIVEEEVTETVFDNHSSDEENSLANDRFKKGEGYHVVPPPLTGNYMPPKPDLSFAGLDDSNYKFTISETVTSLTKNVKDAPKTSTDFVEKPKEVRNNRMAKKYVLPNNVGMGTGYKKSRPVRNNVQRINHQNKFSPTTIFTRSGRIPISAAKPKVAASTSVAKPVNTARPKQTHSKSNSTERVNIAGSKAVSAVKGNGVTAIKALAGCVWRPRGHPQQALKNKGIVDSRCSRHMTGKKAYLADYQEINDGVALVERRQLI
nr:retrovirus-related Pol polyprotein from transposon TNT 1-94 [Tanacetum cinerariifolium]